MRTWMSETFREEVAAHGLVSQVASWNRRLSAMDSEQAECAAANNRVGAYVRYEGGGRSFRLIGQFINVEGTPVFCWLRAMHRNKADCIALYANPREFGEQKLQPILDAERTRIAAFLARDEPEPDDSRLREVASQYVPWLERPRFVDDDGMPLAIVYEAFPWAEAMRNEQVRLHWAARLDLLRDLLAGRMAEFEVVPNADNIFIARRDGRGFVCLRLPAVRDGGTPSAPAVVLIGVLGPETPAVQGFSEASLVARARTIWEGWRATTGRDRLDAIAAHAARCYPEILTWDEDLWLAVEQDPTANLALSAEEEGLLQRMSVGDGGSTGLPLFLHGRAGSGKSTMLARVFASYFDRWKRELLPGRPLFITLNSSLLDRARDEVRQLLSANANYITQTATHTVDLAELEHSFRSFGDLLSEGVAAVGELTGNAALRERYRAEKRVSFSVFKQLYTGENLNSALFPHRCVLPVRTQVTPELAWHVIRTFLKGWKGEGGLDVASYATLPRRDRTVSTATFRRIYDTIWSGWYRELTARGGPLWDDQDRIRVVLEHGWSPDDYTAVFCDESQDFTRIELEWILRLSVLGQLAAYLPRTMPCLPFMFAGDPLQTLNPTGFRWAALRAAFTDELRSLSDGEARWTPTFEQLSHNYRSAIEVVRVVNLLQLWRARTLSLPDVAPQKAWSREPGSATLWVLGVNTSVADLRAHLADAIVIVPAEECGEEAYIQMHPDLRDTLVAADGRYGGVFTALGAKGLEFDRVVVFGFGDAAPERLLEPVSDPEEDIERAHFFNKLYVAASRARKELVILDTETGFRRLWDVLRQTAGALEGFDGAAGWAGEVSDLALGARGEMQYSRMDPRLVAQTLLQRGLQDQDPDLLSRARQFYLRAGDPAGAALAEAWRLRYSGHQEAAGDAFLQLDMTPEALDCFWQGAAWSRLDAWFRQYPPGKPNERGLFASYYASSDSVAVRLERVSRDLRLLLADLHVGAERDRWERWLDNLSGLMSAEQGPTLAADGWCALAGVLQDLGTFVPHAFPVAAQAWTRADRPADAARCWERSGQTQHELYLRARANSSQLPERFEWLDRLKDWKVLVAEWEQGGRPMDPASAGYVGTALLQLGRVAEACRLLIAAGRVDDVVRALGRSGLEESDRATLSLDLLHTAVATERYEAAHAALRILTDAGRTEDVAVWELRVLASLAARGKAATDPAVRLFRQVANRRLVEDRDWHAVLDLEVAGWLVESYLDLKFRDLQQFYRPFLDYRSRPVKLFAQQRFLRAVLAQSRFDEASGRSEQAKRLVAEVQLREREWSLTASRIDVLTAAPISLADALQLQRRAPAIEEEDLREVPGYEFRCVREPPLLAITSLSTLESVRVDVMKRTAAGADLRSFGQRNKKTYFRSEALSLRLEFEDRPAGGVRVHIQIGSETRVAVFG